MREQQALIRLLLITCLCLPLSGQVFSARDTDPDFDAGMAAFRAGDYPEALVHFQFSREIGNLSPTLTYNLAVTHYRLEQYGEAERLFGELARHPQWADLARYNLGLVALRRGQRERAIGHFREVNHSADDRRLRALAARRLDDLQVRVVEPPPPEQAFSGLFNLSGGYDTNVLAFPDQLQEQTAQGEDAFFELLGFVQNYISGDRQRGVRIYGLGHARQYTDLDFLSTRVFSAGVIRDTTVGDWRIEYGGAAVYTDLDGTRVSTDAQLRLGATHTRGANSYRFLYRPAYHFASGEFEQLDGSSHRLEARWRHRTAAARWTTAYRFEYNDREDTTNEDEFFSYSPVRHRVEIDAAWPVAFQWTLSAGAGHEHSRFRGTNRMFDLDGEFREAGRKSDRTEFWFRGEYSFARHWLLGAELRHTRQSDTFDLFEYDRTVGTLGVEYSF